MRLLWSSTWNMFLLLTYLFIHLISLLGSRRTFQLGWQWEPAPGLASNSWVGETKRKPQTTLAAWNTNLRVVSDRLNQNPALSLALILQFLILLPVLHSLFSLSMMGVRLQEEIHLLRESIFPGPLSCRAEKQHQQCGKSSAGPSLRCNKD